MVSFLEQVRAWVERVIEALGYPGILGLMFLEGLFPPIPSEVIMPFAGSLAGQGRLSLGGIVAAGTLGSLLVALLYYGLGRWLDARAVRQFIRRYGRWLFLTEQDWERAMRAFHRLGEGVIFAGRLVPGLRSLISIPAGLDKMPLVPFLLLTTLGSAAWNALLAQIGILLGANWEAILSALDRYEQIVNAVLLGLVALVVLRVLSNAYRGRRAECHLPKPDDLPPHPTIEKGG
jgi:membrane protein DedA with SNARE-associated domain